MATCRLCLTQKKSDELVISLQDIVERLEMKITFQLFLEYHCRTTLDSDPDLPQGVCKDCKVQLEMFDEFGNNVVRNQKHLILNTKRNGENRQTNNNIQTVTNDNQHSNDTENDGLLITIKEEFPSTTMVQAGTSSTVSEKPRRKSINVELRQLAKSIEERNEQPAGDSKKQRLNQDIDENLLIEFPKSENDSIIPKPGRSLMNRRRSIYVEGTDNLKV